MCRGYTNNDQGAVTGPDDAVAKSLANELVGMGSHLGTSFNPEQVSKDQMGRCKATTPSSLSLTTNQLTKCTNSLS